MPGNSMPWITVREAARRAGIGTTRVDLLIAKGVLEVLRLPESPVLVSAADLDRVLKDSRCLPQRTKQQQPATAGIS